MPSMQDLDDAIHLLEAYVAAQIPIITGTLARLGEDLRRFGPPELPQLPEMRSLPLFASVSPPPVVQPPPSVPTTFSDKASDMMIRRRGLLIGGGLVVAVGLMAGGWMSWSSRRIAATRAIAKSKRLNEVAVVLGGDSPLGQLVVHELRESGYIVIVSVASPDSISDVERHGKGFVKALVLDPADPASTTPFMRSLQSTLSLKFPIASGDPYAASNPADIPILVSLISLLSLSSAEPADTTSSASPSDSITTLSISKDYLPHLVSTHLTPLTIIQSIIPLFRTAKKKGVPSPNIIVALRGGVDSIRWPSTAMSNSATATSCEVLRRETAANPDVAGMRVVIIDVGELALKSKHAHHRSPRRPTDPKVFSNAVLRIVGDRRPHQLGLLFSAVLGLKDWWRGDRFSVGAGAGTYSLTRHLPFWFVDTLFLVPQRLLTSRDWVQRKAKDFRKELEKERRRRRVQDRRDRQETEDEESFDGGVLVVSGQRASKSQPSSINESPRSSPKSARSSIHESVPSSEVHTDTDSESGRSPSQPPSEAGVGESWVIDVHASETSSSTASI